MNIYYQNEKASLIGSEVAVGSSLKNIYNPMLMLRTDFTSEHVTITGNYNDLIEADSLCVAYTNASLYKLTIGENNKVYKGRIKNGIGILNFNTEYIDSFELELEGIDPLYLGHLFFGRKIQLPRFKAEPSIGKKFLSEAAQSFGGQVFGLRRNTLGSFAVNFPRITSEEKKIIEDYIETVLNIEPHIIDPYPEAQNEFPPMYVVLDTNEVSLKKLENGFFFSGSLAWQEAR